MPPRGFQVNEGQPCGGCHKMDGLHKSRFTRRDMLKWSAGGAGLFALGATGLAVTRGNAAGGGGLVIEALPTSPLLLEPFRADNLRLVPRASRPVPESVWQNWASPPGPDKPQDSLAAPPDPHAFDDFIAKYGWRPGTHQLWPGRGVTKGYPWLSTTPLV